MKSKEVEKDKAREMRKLGISIREIAKKLNVSKSSTSNWVRDVILTDYQKEKLYQNMIKGYKHSEKTKEKIGIASKKMWELNPNLATSLMGNSVHRKCELKAKKVIERFFRTDNLLPEKIGPHWFDFVNEDFIIEYTTDKTRGISLAIKRFETITNDERKKFLIAPSNWFGLKRRKKLDHSGAIFIPLWF